MCLYPKQIRVLKKNGTLVNITAECGVCIECSRKKCNEWATRLMLEKDCHEHSCCLTLTYDNEHLPSNSCLCKEHVTLFLKRLREFVYPTKIRYFYCGEYGSKKGRPHYHMIVFGWCPTDLVYKFSKRDKAYFLSDTVAKLWSYGHIVVDPELTRETCFYTAKYLQKYVDSDKEVKAFIQMSLKPAIGSLCPEKLGQYIYQNGVKKPLPRALRRSMVRRGCLSQFDADNWAFNAKTYHELCVKCDNSPCDYDQTQRAKYEELIGKPKKIVQVAQQYLCNLTIYKRMRDSVYYSVGLIRKRQLLRSDYFSK